MVLDLLEIEYDQSSAILILLFDRLLIWDPRRAGSPLVEIELNTTEGARFIVSDRAHRGTAFHICFHEHELQRFDKLEPRERLYPGASMRAFEVFDGRIFAISGEAEIFEFDPGGRISILANRDQLIDYLVSLRSRVPFVAKLGTNRVRIRSWISTWLQHPFFRRVEFDGETFFAICFRLDHSKIGNTGVVFWQPVKGFSGYWFFDGRAAEISGFTAVDRATMVSTLLSHFKEDEPLMLWAIEKPARTRRFATDSVGVAISEDMSCLTRIGDGSWLAIDLQGNPYKIADGGSFFKLPFRTGFGPTRAIRLDWRNAK